MRLNIDTMNYQHVQQRPLAVNGVNRRRPDRDSGTRVDSNSRSDSHTWRSSAHIRHSAEATPAHFHGHVDHLNTNHSLPSASGRHSIDKDEMGFSNQNRGSAGKPLHDRLLFLTMCLIGQPVEVQVKNGSIYSGIFHTANAEKGFGVVLKMARLIKDGSVKVGRSDSGKEAARKAPVKTLIIYEKDFVQIIAKDVSLTADPHINGRTRDIKTEILTDSVLSQGRAREVERELKPWKPDTEVPKGLGLESTFQSTWNRNWDQFETNKTLFGVESTFDEELYTTKLERGPQTREREREAWRIAREIEGQSTRNIHLAEERGIRLASHFDQLDEESRFSAVNRLEEADDVGEEEEYEDVDGYNEETFGESYGNGLVSLESPSESSSSVHSAGEIEGKLLWSLSSDHIQVTSPSGSPLEEQNLSSSLAIESADIGGSTLSINYNQVSDDTYRELEEFGVKSRRQHEDQMKDIDPPFTKSTGEGSKPILKLEGGADSVIVSDMKSKSSSPSPGTYSPVAVSSAMLSVSPASFQAVNGAASASIQSEGLCSNPAMTVELIVEPRELSDSGSGAMLIAVPTGPVAGSSASTSLMSEAVNQSSESLSVPVTSNSISIISSSTTQTTQLQTSSMSSGASKKSSLNPNAKEFKLNPYAKAFSPSLNSARPPSPVHQGTVFMAASLHPVAPVPLGLSQIVQQPVQPTQFNQYSGAVAVAAPSVVSASPYMQPHGAFVPSVAGQGGPPVLPAQATMKIPPQAQQQVASPYPQQQVIRYLPQASPMQPAPAYPHPPGQVYQPQVMYGPHGPLLYIQQFPQGVIPGQPFSIAQQSSLPPQPASQPPKYRGGGIEAVHFNLTPAYLPGQPQHIQQAQISNLHTSLQSSPTGLVPGTVAGTLPSHGVVTASGAANQDTYNIGGGNGMRLQGKSPSGSFQLQY